jgi:hypothetical protein
MSDIKWVNLTPHIVKVYRGQKIIRTFWPTSPSARIAVDVNLIDVIDDIPIYTRGPSKTINLPKPRKNTIYIVSSIVLNANPKRTDLVSPESAFLGVKNKQNQIIGVSGFQTIGDSK